MPEIAYKDFDRFVANHNSFASVYLICGEEFLCETVYKKLVNTLLKGEDASLNLESIDGSSGNTLEALENMATFSFLGDGKIVALTNTRIFYSRKDDMLFLEKAKEAFDKKEFKKASKYLLNVLSLNNLAIEDVQHKKATSFLKIDFTVFGGSKWLDILIAFISENGYKVPVHTDESKKMQEAIIRGFPENNHLIITTEVVDRRRVLYKTILKHGIIVDCVVAKGNLYADKKNQELFLRESMNKILVKYNKKMDPTAYQALCEMTGFDLRTFSNSMEQLSIFTGKRDTILLDDVTSVLKRTKIDPIYELTNAISNRNCEDALFFIKSLLKSEFHPLQLLRTMINSIRKLLLMKEFTESSVGNVWNRNMQYYNFQTEVMPVIVKYDKEFSDKIRKSDDKYQKKIKLKEIKKANTKVKSKKTPTDIIIAKNPKSPYPVFLSLQTSSNYSMMELLKAFKFLAQADMRLKSLGNDSRLILEDTVLKICRKKTD